MITWQLALPAVPGKSRRLDVTLALQRTESVEFAAAPEYPPVSPATAPP